MLDFTRQPGDHVDHVIHSRSSLARLARGGFVFLGIILFSRAIAVDFRPLTDFVVDPVQSARLGRTLNLLRGAGPTNHPVVKVVFYGQSITLFPWWREVAQRLRDTYPHARLEISNLAISGFMSDRLAYSVDSDVIPAQPDLVILHDYGYENSFQVLLGKLRTQTTAEVLVQRDHPLTDAELAEETDPAVLAAGTPGMWEAKNYLWLPRLADRNGCCLGDVRGYYKQYCRERGRRPTDLLADQYHPNEEGDHVMAAAVMSYLLPDTPVPVVDPWSTASVLGLALPREPWRPASRLTVEFTGTRLDAVTDRPGAGPVAVRVDGSVPSSIPELRKFLRASPVPGGSWPAISGLTSKAPLLAETWTLSVTRYAEDNGRIEFRVDGSETGFDGAGASSTNFVSNSGRVIIPYWSWLVGYAINLQHIPLPPDYKIVWECKWVGMDSFVPGAPAEPGSEPVFTLASGLADGVHRVELESASLEGVRALRVYRPTGPVSARLVDRVDVSYALGFVRSGQGGGASFHMAESHAGNSILQTSTNLVDWLGIVAAGPGAPDWSPFDGEPRRFYRVVPRLP